MFKIVLVIGIIYNTLDVALVVPDGKLQATFIFFFLHQNRNKNLFWPAAEEFLQPAVELVNTVRLVIHEDTLPVDIVDP